MKRIIFFVVMTSATLFLLSSCVPSRKYNDLLTSKSKLEADYNEYKKQNELQTAQIAALNRQLSALERMKRDSVAQKNEYDRLKTACKEVEYRLEQSLKQNEREMSAAVGTQRQLEEQLAAKQRELNEKASNLAALEVQLNASRLGVERAQADVKAAQEKVEAAQAKLNAETAKLNAELAAREKRLQELETVIAKQKAVADELRRRVNDALLGFDAADLTVEQRDGKVYVSLSQNLLFASGSTTMDAKGRTAISKLAEVLKKNPDIDIAVEGHTDNVPLGKGGTIKDNWDLSVLRSTTIVRVLQELGVDPKRITASGRGEYFPKVSNATKESRAQNRRSEIILSPKLDALYQIINQ